MEADLLVYTRDNDSPDDTRPESFNVTLSDRWDVGMQTEFNFNKNTAKAGYNIGFVNTVSFGYEISPKWSTYFELFTQIRTEQDSRFVATFDTELNYLLTENIQLDVE